MQRSKCRWTLTTISTGGSVIFDTLVSSPSWNLVDSLILLSCNRKLAIMQSCYLRWPGHLAPSQSLACPSQFLEPHAGTRLSWALCLLDFKSHSANKLSLQNWISYCKKIELGGQLNCRRRLTWALEVRSSKDSRWRRWVEVFFLHSILLSTAFLLVGDKVEGHRHRLVDYLSQASRGSLRTSPQWSRDSASSNHRLHGTWGRRGAIFLHGRTQVWETFGFFCVFIFLSGLRSSCAKALLWRKLFFGRAQLQRWSSCLHVF